jgi:fructose-bisphosphate aldolase class II
MALVDMGRLMDDALKKKYTIGAYNVFNLDTISAVLEAAEEENSPVILQMSMGSRKYQYNVPRFVEVIKLYAQAAEVPVSINHDHCLKTEDAKSAVDLGFLSVMFDGSHLDYETNINRTREIADYAHSKGVWVEAELGSLPGMEDEVFSENAAFTDPDLVVDYIKRSKCDSLAVSIGTTHGGVKADNYLPLHFEILEKIHNALGDFPLVLHGAASLPEHLVKEVNQYGGKVKQLRNCSEEDIAACREYGICKANMDVDNFLLCTARLRKVLLEIPEKYNPRGYLREAREAFKIEVKHKMRNVSGSSGKNWLTGGAV